MQFTLLANLLLASLALVDAHPGHHHHDARQFNLPFSASKFPDVQRLIQGNQVFRQTRNAPKIQNLVDEGQKPPFMMFSCSDSRVQETSIFNSEPGTFFMGRNIANQYKPGDENAQSAMAYGVRVLGAQHVIVMGHYGCGGIAAAIASAPKKDIDVATHIVQTWIGDVRQLYLSSNRTEIVEMRTRNLAIEASGGIVEEPEVRDAGFRALVEENVRVQVKRISESSVITMLNEEIVTTLNVDGSRKVASVGKRAEEGELIPVFVHGWVHDIETGEIIDLNISTGPPGFENFVPSILEQGSQQFGIGEPNSNVFSTQVLPENLNLNIPATSESVLVSDVNALGVTTVPIKKRKITPGNPGPEHKKRFNKVVRRKN